MKTKYNKEELIEAVKKSYSIAETCRNLSIRPIGGNYKTLNILIKEFNIDITHFTGQGWNVGLKFRPMKTYSLEDILVENSQYRSSYGLKKKLFGLGVKQEKCEICLNSLWNDKKIPLELHREVEYRKFKEASASNVGGNLEPSLRNKKGAETRHGTPKSKPPKRTCHLCDNTLTRNQKIYCSTECYFQGTKGKRPPVFELIKKFEELKSFVSVGKFYNVSDNAIRKWCSYYGILDMVKV